MFLDPLDFDRKVDGTLPLEDKIKFDPSVRKLLEDIDRSKARVWGLTNAFLPVCLISSSVCSFNAFQHAKRVLRILKLDDLVEGIVYCDYRVKDFFCKPEAEYFGMVRGFLLKLFSRRLFDSMLNNYQAMKQAGLSDLSKCYFVDDSRGHVDAARAVGWAKCVHFCERENLEGEKIQTERENGVVEIATLEQLRSVWPEIFVEHP